MEALDVRVNDNIYYVLDIYSNCSYGRESVHHILTHNEIWARKDIEVVMNTLYKKTIESKGLHDLNYKRNPNIFNALKPYYTLEFKDNDNVFDYSKYGFDGYYIYTYKEPYDD